MSILKGIVKPNAGIYYAPVVTVAGVGTGQFNVSASSCTCCGTTTCVCSCCEAGESPICAWGITVTGLSTMGISGYVANAATLSFSITRLASTGVGSRCGVQYNIPGGTISNGTSTYQSVIDFNVAQPTGFSGCGQCVKIYAGSLISGPGGFTPGWAFTWPLAANLCPNTYGPGYGPGVGCNLSSSYTFSNQYTTNTSGGSAYGGTITIVPKL